MKKREPSLSHQTLTGEEGSTDIHSLYHTHNLLVTISKAVVCTCIVVTSDRVRSLMTVPSFK